MKAITNFVFSVIVAAVFASATQAATDSALPDDPYASRKIFYEQHWQKKIESVLRYVNGAVVAVNVVLSTDIEKKITTERFDEEAIIECKATRSSVSQDSEKDTNEEESHENYVIPRSEIVTSVAGLIPIGVTVSVSVPDSYYEAVWRRHNSRGSTQLRIPKEGILEIERLTHEKIKLAIAVLVPRELAKNQLSDVRVTSFEDMGNSELHRVSAINPPTEHPTLPVADVSTRSSGQ